MNLEMAPLTTALFFLAAIVLSGFTLYAHKAGKIRASYTTLSGALLGVIFAILVAMFTADLLMATAIALVIFGWFFALSRSQKPKPTPLFKP